MIVQDQRAHLVPSKMKGETWVNTSREPFFLFQRLLTLLITSLKLWKPNNHKYIEYLNIWERSHLKRTLKSSLLLILWVCSLLGKLTHELRSCFCWGPLSNTAAIHLRSITILLCIFIRYLSKCIEICNSWLEYYFEIICLEASYRTMILFMLKRNSRLCVRVCVCVCKETKWNWKDTNIKSGYLKDIQNFVKI